MIWTAFAFGVFGNFHCLGMCGPLALSIPFHQDSPWKRAVAILIYNLGRIGTYAVFGAVFGLFGKGLELAGVQQTISILLGVLLILSVLLSRTYSFDTVAKGKMGALVLRLKSRFAQLLKQGSWKSLGALGLINGLLPCGLVYMALAGALITGTWYEGALYMALFGLGTLPVMFLVPYFGDMLKGRWRLRLRRVVPYTMVLFGLLLILRGANLGIPYVSPKLEQGQSCCTVKCH